VTRFQEVLARAVAMAALAPASAALWPRFAGYYQGLARLPRKARRYTFHILALLSFLSFGRELLTDPQRKLEIRRGLLQNSQHLII
jgi:hypothetical protein